MGRVCRDRKKGGGKKIQRWLCGCVGGVGYGGVNVNVIAV